MSFAMSVVLGLGVGGGLLLILQACIPSPPRPVKKQLSSSRVRRLLDQAGHRRVPAATVGFAVAACALVTFAIIFALTHAVPIALCFAVFAAGIPWVALTWQVEKRRRTLAEVWPHVADHLRSAVRSGLSLPEALRSLSSAGPEPLRDQFAEFARQWQAGVPLDDALQDLKDRLADPVGDRIVMALQVTRELGGSDLGRLLGTLSEVLRENSRTRSELEARQSWTVNGAKLAVMAPWIVVLLLSMQPEAAESYRGASGMAVLGIGLVVSVLCYRVMKRIGALPREERVLA